MLRFLFLALTLLVVFAAQFIFEQSARGEPFPLYLLQALPWLGAWRAGALEQLAFWAALTAGLAFGLAAPGWPLWPRNETAATRPPAVGRALWQGLAALACGMTAAVALLLALGWPEAAWMHWAWLGGVALLLAAAAWATLPRQRAREPLSGQGWLLLLAVLLAVTALLVGWGGAELPIAVDRTTARSGLAAATLLADPAAPFFAPSRVGAPGVAHAPLALLLWLRGDGPAAVHLLANSAALLLVGGVWLLGSELLRRPGASPGALALLAAGLTAVAIPLFHFGRTAPGLLAVSFTVLAGWLLLRGLRRENPLALAASGLLTGAAALLDRTGLVAPLLLMLWWLGLALLRPASAPPRWGYFGWWLAGLLVIGGPVAGVWLRDPAALAIYARGHLLAADLAPAWPLVDLWANLRNNFLGLMWLPDAGAAVSFPDHFLPTLAAPLLWLAAGALLVNLDRFVGWALAAWLLVGLLFASSAAPVAPDWAVLTPLLPGLALALAFAGDRFYAAWRSPEYGWPASTAAYLLAGLLVALGLNGAVAYFNFAATNQDAASAVGWAARAAAPQPRALVASPAVATPALDDEIVQFLAGQAPPPLLFSVAELPPALPPGTHLLLMPGDQAALAAVRAQHPGGALTVVRDLRANPQLLVYRLP